MVRSGPSLGCPVNWTAYGWFLGQCYSDPYQNLIVHGEVRPTAPTTL